VPRFNSRAGVFMGAVRSNYRSYFQRECVANEGRKLDKYLSSYEDFNDASPEQDNEYYNKPRPRPRRYYKCKSTTYFIRKEYE
jgi:hypothetical protein